MTYFNVGFPFAFPFKKGNPPKTDSLAYFWPWRSPKLPPADTTPMFWAAAWQKERIPCHFVQGTLMILSPDSGKATGVLT